MSDASAASVIASAHTHAHTNESNSCTRSSNVFFQIHETNLVLVMAWIAESEGSHRTPKCIHVVEGTTKLGFHFITRTAHGINSHQGFLSSCCLSMFRSSWFQVCSRVRIHDMPYRSIAFVPCNILYDCDIWLLYAVCRVQHSAVGRPFASEFEYAARMTVVVDSMWARWLIYLGDHDELKNFRWQCHGSESSLFAAI